ncbi:MAG: hypothetical protein ACSHYB_03600 [Roseibacillus sp.]
MRTFLQVALLMLIAAPPIHGVEVPEPGDDLKSFLEGVTLAYVPFKEESKVEFLDALGYVISKSITLDSRENGSRLGMIRFVENEKRHHKDCVVVPDELDGVFIVFEEREVSLLKVVIEIAKQSKLDLYTSSAGLVFCRPNQVPKVDRHNDALVIGAPLYRVNGKPKALGSEEGASKDRPSK